jgi:predicted metal-dependent hydrolase
LDEIPTDQLGKKLKSFTEWLKSMKKIQPDKVDRQMDSDTENHIRKEAEHSNDSQEVYTEALAEVYLKQGLEDKAVDVFKKLSLLDPSKSAYFAARIREIKEI